MKKDSYKIIYYDYFYISTMTSIIPRLFLFGTWWIFKILCIFIIVLLNYSLTLIISIFLRFIIILLKRSTWKIKKKMKKIFFSGCYVMWSIFSQNYFCLKKNQYCDIKYIINDVYQLTNFQRNEIINRYQSYLYLKFCV